MAEGEEARQRKDDEAPPRELVVDARAAPGDASVAGGPAMAPFALPAIAAGLLAKFVSLTAGAVCVGAAIVVLLLRRRPREGRFVLKVVEPGVLEVTRERSVSAPVRIALVDLFDVTLDRKTSPSGRGSTDRCHVVLERRPPDAPVVIPDERITALEAQEWHARVRVFLRKHGWVPEDERSP